MVPEGDRLRGLQMGEPRHRIGRMGGGAFGQAQHHVGDLPGQPVDRIAHPQAKIRGDLVVAAARGVQALAGLAYALGQTRLDIHMDVF